MTLLIGPQFTSLYYVTIQNKIHDYIVHQKANIAKEDIPPEMPEPSLVQPDDGNQAKMVGL